MICKVLKWSLYLMPYKAGNSTCSTLKKKKTLIQSKKKLIRIFKITLLMSDW